MNPTDQTPLQTSKPKPARKPRPSRRRAAAAKPPLSVEELQRKLESTLGRLPGPTLKHVLIAAGIAVGVAALIVFLAKFLPVGLVLLAVLGLGLVLRCWQELRRLLGLA